MRFHQIKILSRKTFLTLAIIFFGKMANGQPSSSISFVFRLYHHGKVIDKDQFCREWKILNGSGGFISPCDQNAAGNYYDSVSQYFHIHIGAIYPPYIFTLRHEQKSMTLYFPNETNLLSDSMTIHSDSFLFDHSCSDSTKITIDHVSGLYFCPLNQIDWMLQHQKFEQSMYYQKKE